MLKRDLLGKEPLVVSSLVNMYARCGALAKAKDVFEALPVRDVVSWSALIAGYDKDGCANEALNCYGYMQYEGLCPDTVTFVCVLRACSSIKALETGMNIHAKIVERGMLRGHVVLGGALMDMYVKCGALDKAKEVLEGLPIRNVVCWNVLIAGYTQYSHGKEALSCYRRMLLDGISPDAITFTCALTACGNIRALDKGKQIHQEIARQGLLGGDIVLGNALVDMYVKCRAFMKAKEAFDTLLTHDVVSWNALISGYVHWEHAKEAFICLEQMLHEGFLPDAVTLTCILKSCGSIRALDKGEKIHSEIVAHEVLDGHSILGNALVDMYAKCGAVAKAKEVLERLSSSNVVSWNALISGYVQGQNYNEAVHCFERMQHEGFSPNAVTFGCMLKVFGSMRAPDKGQKVHFEVVKQGLLSKNVLLGNALVDMYAKCGVLVKAKEVLEELAVRSVVSWSALIGGYAQIGYCKEALECLDQMQCEGLFPNVVTFICILTACSSLGSLNIGRKVHFEIMKHGLMSGEIVLGGALVDMYVKCGDLAQAKTVLDGLSIRDVISWNAIIAGYAAGGYCKEALECFDQMQDEGLCPNEVTFSSILKACGNVGALDEGKQLHYEIVRRGLLGRYVILGFALVDMYASCGVLARAKELHDGLLVRDLVSWSALIGGYVQGEHGKEALNCFECMQRVGFSPDAVMFASILRACCSTGALDKGVKVHSEIVRCGLLGGNILLGSTLVDMYAKCGALAKAKQVLESLSARNVVSWNCLISGYAQAEHGKEALSCLEQLLCEGLSPDKITFLCVLSTCNHLCLVDEAQRYFKQMGMYGILPILEHFTCMVDLFGRAGLLDKAIAITKQMCSSNYAPLLCALLVACREWGNMKLGIWAFEYGTCSTIR